MSSNYLPTSYQEFIHLSRYSRWLPEEKRRETWNETISRYFNFFDEHLKEMHDYKVPKVVRDKLENGVLGLDVMPSMRCLMTAGEALKRENIAGYNCSYVAVNRVQAFDEILYVLMNGTGVGFSVERQEVSQLPQVASTMQFDLEYDNLVMASMRGRAGQVMGGGFSGGRAQLGVRTTKAVKRVGCSNLKQLVEDSKLIIEDLEIINELSTFIIKGQSFEADEGCNDDLVSCLFLFAWATDQQYFKELADQDIRATMMREQQDALEQDMAPFGFVVNGLEDENIGEMVDEYGTRWNPVVRDYGSNW
jgi:hypothetical protein